MTTPKWKKIEWLKSVIVWQFRQTIHKFVPLNRIEKLYITDIAWVPYRRTIVNHWEKAWWDKVYWNRDEQNEGRHIYVQQIWDPKKKPYVQIEKWKVEKLTYYLDNHPNLWQNYNEISNHQQIVWHVNLDLGEYD